MKNKFSFSISIGFLALLGKINYLLHKPIALLSSNELRNQCALEKDNGCEAINYQHPLASSSRCNKYDIVYLGD